MSGIYSVNLIDINIQQVNELSNKIDFVSADLKGENLFESTITAPYCLVMGNEANGISKEIRDITKNIYIFQWKVE